MTALESEWVEKALRDLGSAKIILDSGREYYDQVCFLAQQAIEKLLKAYLIKRKIEFFKIHDLVKLTTDCSKFNPKFLGWKNVALSLTTYAVDFRYPGETATKEEAYDSYQKAEEYSNFILSEMKNNI